MSERTETDVLLERAVAVRIAGQEIEVKPVRGFLWLEVMEELAQLLPREELKKRLRLVKSGGKSVMNFDASDFAGLLEGDGLSEIVDVLLDFTGSRLVQLFELTLKAMQLTDEQAAAIRAEAEPDELLLALREVAPVVFPLDRFQKAMEVMGLTGDEEGDEEEEGDEAKDREAVTGPAKAPAVRV